ncbi:MAG: hypothetical protein ABIR25_06955 [Sphingomicrobium sp.]
MREVGTIVLGVLIALVIGEIANAVRQRVEAQRSMAAVRADMIDNSSTLELMAPWGNCALKRLDALSAELAIVRKTGRLRDIGDVDGLFGTTYRSGSWESAVANRDVLFLDPARVADLTDYHEVLSLLRVNRDEINLGWARLTVMSHAAGRMDDNTFSSLNQSIAELRYRTKFSLLAARILIDAHRRLGFPVVYTPMNGKPQTREAAWRGAKADPVCQPLEVAPGGK